MKGGAPDHRLMALNVISFAGLFVCLLPIREQRCVVLGDVFCGSNSQFLCRRVDPARRAFDLAEIPNRRFVYDHLTFAIGSIRREIFRSGKSARTPSRARSRPSSFRPRRRSPIPRGCCGGPSCRRFCESASKLTRTFAVAAVPSVPQNSSRQVIERIHFVGARSDQTESSGSQGAA